MGDYSAGVHPETLYPAYWILVVAASQSVEALMIILDAVDMGEIFPMSARSGTDSNAFVSRGSTVTIDWANTVVDTTMERIRIDTIGNFMMCTPIYST